MVMCTRGTLPPAFFDYLIIFIMSCSKKKKISYSGKKSQELNFLQELFPRKVYHGTKSLQTHQSYSLRPLLEVFNKFPDTAM